MIRPINMAVNPKLDLVLERVVNVAPELVWKAWTTPEILKQWFCPVPWMTVECDIDLRPGGTFRTVMRSPEGQDMPANAGCYLEVVPGSRLVWTTALLPGYRPATAAGPEGAFTFTCFLTLEPHGTGTRYTATVIHRDEIACRTHNEMGFHAGWGAALDQLVALMKE